MKKIVLLLLVLISTLAKAQYVTNPGFEQWISVGGWFENPVGWQTNNYQIMNPVTKDQVHATEGQYAMSVNFNGWAQCRFNVQADVAGFFFDWYYTSTVADTALVIMDGYYNGSVAGIDTAKFYTNASGSTGEITFPGLLLWVDSIDIVVKGGHSPNTQIVLDNFREIITGVEEAPTVNANLRYASLNQQFIVTIHANATLFLYNSAGMLVRQLNVNSSENTIDLTSFATGIYYAQLLSSGENQRLKFSKY